MTKTPSRIFVGQILDKQDSVKTYNESQEGLIYNNQDIGIRTQIEGADREVLTDTQTQTMSAKTVTLSTVESSAINSCTLSQSVFNVDNNTLSNVEVDNLKSGVLLTTVVSVSINDTNLFSAKCIKDYVDLQDSGISGSISSHIAQVTGAHAASAISLTATGSISSTNVQTGMVELQDDINLRELASNKGSANGYCPLGADQKVPAANLPSYVDDVLEYANLAAFPVTGEANKIYIAIDTNLTYRWTGSVYAEISQSLALGETSTTAYRGDRGKTAYDHSQTTSGSHGITGSFVGTTDTQIITNKDIDGGVAANTRRITFPSDTLANLNSLTRKEGTVVYATDTDKLYYDNGSTLTAVGSGSGSGDLATYAQLKSDDDTGTWSTGNNATFLGGGSIAGTFTKQNATNPLNGTYSYTLVQAAGSLNDYVASDVQAVPLRSRGVTNSTDLVYTYDGSDNDIKWVVYDVTNATVVTPVTAYVKASSVGKTAQLVYDLPVTCTQVRFGAQVVVANNTKTLKFDDVQLATWTPQAVNLVEQESITYTGYTSKNASNYVLFKTLDTARSNGKNVVTVNEANKSVYIRYDILKKSNVVVNFNADYSVVNPVPVQIVHYDSAGVIKKVSDSANGTNTGANGTSLTTQALAGDYFIANTGAVPSDSYYTNFSITATAISDNVVQSWQDGTEWTSYTPTFANFGSPTNVNFKYRRDGSDLLIQGFFTPSAVSAAIAGVYLPSGLTIASGLGSFNQVVGSVSPNSLNSAGYKFNVLAVGGEQLIRFGESSTNNGLTNINSNLFAQGVSISLNARIPIQGWSSAPTLLALPVSKENVFSARISSAGAISSQNVSWISSVTKNATGDYTINFNTGVTGFTVAPSVSITPDNAGVNDKAFSYNTPTTSAIGVKTYSSSAVATDSAFNIIIQKQSPDYQATGVFVGSLSGQWQYDLTLSGGSYTSTIRAVGIVYKCDSGQYRLKLNASYNVSSGTRTSHTITLSGITFKNVSDYSQVGTGSNNGSTYSDSVYVTRNTGNITSYHNSLTTTVYHISGDFELESKPTWATSTP